MSKIQRGKSPCYCMNIRRAAGAVSNIYDKFLTPIDLSVNQFSLLLNLNRLEVCSVSDLAVYIGLERTTVVRTIKPLIERGLITDISSDNQRNRKLTLTAEGKEKIEKGLPLWENAQNFIKEHLGEEKVKTLYSILDEFNEIKL